MQKMKAVTYEGIRKMSVKRPNPNQNMNWKSFSLTITG
jgi:Alcohol dehydrogenase GroES-associated